MLEKCRNAGHNLYRRGREIERVVPAVETPAARRARLFDARVHIARAECSILELQEWIQGEIPREEELLAQLNVAAGTTKLDIDEEASKIR